MYEVIYLFLARSIQNFERTHHVFWYGLHISSLILSLLAAVFYRILLLLLFPLIYWKSILLKYKCCLHYIYRI
jgi:hypothetical protein